MPKISQSFTIYLNSCGHQATITLYTVLGHEKGLRTNTEPGLGKIGGEKESVARNPREWYQIVTNFLETCSCRLKFA